MKKKKFSFDVNILIIAGLVIVIFVLLAIIVDYEMFHSALEWLSFDNVFWAVAITLVTSIALIFFEKKLFKASENKKTKDLVSKDLIKDLKQIIDENKQNISSYLKYYSPLKTYQATDTPIDEFNNIINQEFLGSQTYRYMGDRAEYLSFRLDKLKTLISNQGRGRGLDVEIFLPNIENDYFISAQLDSLKRKPAYVGIENSDELRARIIKDYKISIIKSLCAFFHMSSYYQFNIYFYDDLPFIRYELLENVMVLSLLTMDCNKKYPPTFIYSKDSAYFNAFSQYHYNMKKLNQSKGLRHFDNASLNLSSIEEYALNANLTEDDIKEVIK